MCNFALNTRFINDLGLTVVGGTDSQEWLYHGETPNVGGFVTRFSNNVDFVTVRGSGHFVPEGKGLYKIYNVKFVFKQVKILIYYIFIHSLIKYFADKPREALQLIYNFIHQRDYSLPAPV